VVQLGVYGNVKTAIDLRERLRKAGYSAFTEEVSTPSGKALRVRVGPELDRAAAQALLARLERETGHQGMVMSYP
jgi:DedD protein